MRGYALLSQGSAVFARLCHVAREQVLNAIGAQGSATRAGEQCFGILSALLTHPRSEDCGRRFRQRGTAFVRPLRRQCTCAPAPSETSSCRNEVISDNLRLV